MRKNARRADLQPAPAIVRKSDSSALARRDRIPVGSLFSTASLSATY
jgi:hypothetical protein